MNVDDHWRPIIKWCIYICKTTDVYNPLSSTIRMNWELTCQETHSSSHLSLLCEVPDLERQPSQPDQPETNSENLFLTPPSQIISDHLRYLHDITTYQGNPTPPVHWHTSKTSTGGHLLQSWVAQSPLDTIGRPNNLTSAIGHQLYTPGELQPGSQPIVKTDTLFVVVTTQVVEKFFRQTLKRQIPKST